MASGERSLFGWLHRPAQATQAKLGLVICKPFGFEALCGQRSLRTIADTAADAGIPALRFDYSGCGDSQDLAPDADQIEHWIQDIQSAVAHLRQRSGVERVCLFGVRLGALLACLTAMRSESIHGLYLFAPVISGRRYMKELRAAQIAESSSQAPNEPRPASLPTTDDPDAAEYGGFILSAASVATLSGIDLGKSARPPGVADLFIADRADLPSAAKWSSQLKEAGIASRYEKVPGFPEMALVAPHWAQVPAALLSSLRHWLREQAGDIGPAVQARSREVQTPSPPIYINPERSLTLSSAVSETAIQVLESPVVIRSDAQIFGIVTRPNQPEQRRRCVILLNTGVDYHMGVSRVYVTLARNWARCGYHVLRMDLTGIGDSGNAAGQPLDVVYSSEALNDIRAAVDFMRSRYCIKDVTLAGVCSGAYHALRAAAAAVPVQQVLMVNPLTYFWQPGSSLDGLQLAEIVRNPGVYRQRATSGKAWKRLLTGQVNVWRINKIYLKRLLLPLRSRTRDLARTIGLQLANDLGRELQEIAARGVRIVFVFAKGEVGLELLQIEAGSALRKLGPLCRIRVIDEGDHTFTQHGPRTMLEKVLSEELFSQPLDNRHSAGPAPRRAPVHIL